MGESNEVVEVVSLGAFGPYWVAHAPWTGVTTQGRSLEEAAERIAEAVDLRRTVSPAPPLPQQQLTLAVPGVARRPAVPAAARLDASGAAVERALVARGFTIPTRSRHHVVLHHRETGRVVVLPLDDNLAEPTVLDLVRQAAAEHRRVRALL